MNAARYFMRREDYQPLKTHSDRTFRRFNVSCLKCGSVKLRVIGEFDSETGELSVFLFCPSCRERELLPMRWIFSQVMALCKKGMEAHIMLDIFSTDGLKFTRL